MYPGHRYAGTCAYTHIMICVRAVVHATYVYCMYVFCGLHMCGLQVYFMCSVTVGNLLLQGVRNIKKTSLSPVYILIKPPSLEELVCLLALVGFSSHLTGGIVSHLQEKRLRGRGTETEESLSKRLSVAKTELEYGESFKSDTVTDNNQYRAGQNKRLSLASSKSDKKMCRGI